MPNRRNGRIAIVDGSNIAWEEQTSEGKPKVSNLVAVRKALRAMDYDPIIVIDAALHHDIDDPEQLESLIDGKQVRQAPAGTDADYFVLRLAEEYHAKVVSNDRFQDRRDEFPWIRKARWPLMIARGHVTLYDESSGDG